MFEQIVDRVSVDKVSVDKVTVNAMMSIKQCVDQAEQQFSRISESAKLDAQLLLAHVLQKNVTYLHTWPEQVLTAEQLESLESLIARRLTGEPIAYILGKQEFWSLAFHVSPATLIPRPDTEVLVETVLEHHGQLENLHCLDLGTGTGAIALALASEKSSWQVEAVDYNFDAVSLAQKNATELGLTQVNIYQSDWFSKVNSTSLFNIIVSNPPYIDEDDHHLAQGDVRFEPKSALVAENEGLADIIKIAEQAKHFLAEHGYLYVEHGYQQALQVQNILTDLGYQNVATVKDYGGNDRITYGKV